MNLIEHDTMTREGIAAAMKKFALSEAQIRIIIQANQDMDVEPDFSDSRSHFDNCAFTAGAMKIMEDRLVIGSEPDRLSGAALRQFGRMLHTVQDFYAHSNWVEFHAGQESIPVWDLNAASLPADVISANYKGNITCDKPNCPSHHQLNKDNGLSQKGSAKVDSGPHQGKTWWELTRPAAVAATTREAEWLLSAGTTFRVLVKTGDHEGAGTDANVFIILRGKGGAESGRIYLNNIGRDDFTRGSVGTFLICANRAPETITSIAMGYDPDSAGPAPAWYLEWCTLLDLTSLKSWRFSFDGWIRPDSETKQAMVALDPAPSRDGLAFQPEQPVEVKAGQTLVVNVMIGSPEAALLGNLKLYVLDAAGLRVTDRFSLASEDGQTVCDVDVRDGYGHLAGLRTGSYLLRPGAGPVSITGGCTTYVAARVQDGKFKEFRTTSQSGTSEKQGPVTAADGWVLVQSGPQVETPFAENLIVKQISPDKDTGTIESDFGSCLLATKLTILRMMRVIDPSFLERNSSLLELVLSAAYERRPAVRLWVNDLDLSPHELGANEPCRMKVQPATVTAVLGSLSFSGMMGGDAPAKPTQLCPERGCTAVGWLWFGNCFKPNDYWIRSVYAIARDKDPSTYANDSSHPLQPVGFLVFSEIYGGQVTFLLEPEDKISGIREDLRDATALSDRFLALLIKERLASVLPGLANMRNVVTRAQNMRPKIAYAVRIHRHWFVVQRRQWELVNGRIAVHRLDPLYGRMLDSLTPDTVVYAYTDTPLLDITNA